MLFFGVLSLLVAAVSATTCGTEMSAACGTKGSSIDHCTAMYGKFKETETKLQGFAMANIRKSFHLLLISSYFGNYDVNREGFKKLYRQYSDKLWEDAIDVMKYIAKRDGKMDFEQQSVSEKTVEDKSTKVSFEEIQSLARVLDEQKKLADDAFDIHKHSQTGNNNYDPAIAHYIEERFLEKYTERIRDLSGYIFELKNLSKTKSTIPESMFLFDEYLKKAL